MGSGRSFAVDTLCLTYDDTYAHKIIITYTVYTLAHGYHYTPWFRKYHSLLCRYII